MKTKSTHFLTKMYRAFALIGIMLFMGVSVNAQSYFIVGTGTSTNSTYGAPSPYAQYYTGDHSQYLYTASELQALGMAAGSFVSVAFDVVTASPTTSAGSNLTNYTIKMGSTSATVLTSTFVTGLTQVYTTSSYTSTTGWNTHTFTTPFVWDGVSNVVVDISFDNYVNVGDYSSNAIAYYTAGFTNCAHYYRTDNGLIASTTTGGSLISNRPNMKFGLTMVPQTNDLAMVEWVSPQSPVTPSATMPITIKYRNAGVAMVDTFDVKYSIDGGTTFVTETINDSISAGDTLSYTFTTTANMPMGVYNCVAQVKSPGDTMTANDEITYTVYSGNPLSGTYTIGLDTTDDFSSFTQAVNMLQSFGVSGACTFMVDSATFNEQVNLVGPINGASIINTITFKGKGANSVITAAPSSSDRDIFYIANQNYVTLDSLTMVATSTDNYNCGIRINASDSVTIKNCNISVPLNTSSYTNGILISGSKTSYSSATHANYLRIENNTVIGGYYALRLYASSSSHSTNINVSNNSFENYRYYGIYSYYQDSVTYTNNTLFDRGNYGYGYGMYLYKNYLGSEVANNNITSKATTSGYGMYVNYCEGSLANPFMVYNNMVASTQATGSPYGIYSYYGKNVYFYYNTVAINAGGSNSRALYVSGSTSSSSYENIKFKNNVFVNNGTGYAVYYNSTYYPAKITEIDYNNLYVADTTKFARMGSDYTNLAAWKASITGLDANSISMNPVFFGVDDLHAASIAMNGLATPISGIDSDIDGDIRNTSTPDMGADEYTPPANEVAVVEYYGVSGSGCGYTSTEQVGVILQNNGTNNQTNIPVKFTVDGGTVVSETIASLASLAVDTFYFTATADLSVAGMHEIKAYVDMTIDENRSNDTVVGMVTSIGSISSFPYVQDFEAAYTEMGLEYAAQSDAAISTRAANGGNNGLMLTGKTSSNWGYPYNTVIGAFNNTDHIAKATSCDVNATALANLKLKFDMKMNATYNTTYGWFRLMLNDTVYAKDVNGDSTWNANATGGNDQFQSLIFDLTSYAGTQFTISYQSSCKYDNANYSSGSYGDEVFIDNIKMYEIAQNDLGVVSLESPMNTICEDTAMPVSVLVTNYGLATQNNVPVSAVVTLPSGSNVTLTGVSGTIAANATDTVSLGALNASTYGVYNVVSYATLAGDTMYQDNDTLTTSFEVYAPFAVDYVDDFEAATSMWEGNNMYIGYGHGNPGNGLYQNFYGYNPTGDARLGRKIGPITTGSDLVFDYQIINYSGGGATTLEADSFFFMVSNNCGNSIDTLFVVDSNSHTATTDWTHKQLDLSSYVGENIIIAFSGQHNGSGDYYFNIDNFGVATPPTVDLGVDTAICYMDTLTIDAGAGMGYSYLWTSNGDTLAATTSSIMVDSAATYTVEVSAPAGMAYDTIVVSVNALPVVSFTGLNASYCTNDMASTLVGTPANGTFSGNGISGSMFDPAISSLGVQVINYSYTDSNACTSDMNDTTMVYEAPMAMMSMDTTICEGQSVMISAGSTVAAPGVFFSSYIEGSSNNKAIEVYNATNDTVQLDEYSIMTNYNGNPWSGQYHFPAGATLVPGDVFVIANVAAASDILAVADDSLAYNEGGYVVGYNGDDVRALYHHTTATDSAMVDLIGRYDLVDPGSGWDVAGVVNATKDHTLKRKSNIVGGNTNWDAIAGNDSLSSEYLVYAKNTFTMLGSHTAMASVAPSYAWSTGDTTAMITVMPTATTVYTVTVSNTNCSDIDSVTVTVNPLPVVNLGADTTIKWSWAITLDAGNPNASWTWSTGATTQTETLDSTNLTNSAANTIFVDVVENGCASSDTIVITVMDDVSINGSMNDVNMNIYPNPNNGQYTMTIDGVNGEINMEVIDLTGQVVYREKLEATSNYSAQFDMSTLATGVYYIKLTNNDGVKTQKLIIK